MEDLLRIAVRLRESIAEDDLIVHLNGDDFGILVNRLNDPADALKVAQDLLNTLRQPIMTPDGFMACRLLYLAASGFSRG